MKSRVPIALVLGVLLCAPATASDPREFYQREMAGLSRALADPGTNARVQSIWVDLVDDTGMMFPVLPAQQFTLGQALPNGVVLLDLSVAGNRSVEVTAFWLAHEYAHQVFGHPRLLVSPMGRWIAAKSGSRQEDDADRWAGRFMKRAGYEVGPALEFLCSLPETGGRGPHSPGPVRAANVARAYGARLEDPCRSDLDDTDTEIRTKVRIWSRHEGNPTSMRFAVDGEDMGTLENFTQPEILDLGTLSRGTHSFEMSEITVYGPAGGLIASDLSCRGRFHITERKTFLLSARLTPYGGVFCALQ